MRSLIVDDDFIGRMLLQKILAPLGECDVAVNGREAVEAFTLAWDHNEPYDAIFLDIVMPTLSGKEAAKEIRDIEEQRGITGKKRAQIIMITGMDDSSSVIGSFKRGPTATSSSRSPREGEPPDAGASPPVSSHQEVIANLKPVCICMGIKRGAMKKAIEEGAATVEAVRAATGAGRGSCGGTRCTPRIEELLAECAG